MFKENTLNVDQVLKEENNTKAGNKFSKMAVGHRGTVTWVKV